MLLTNDIMIAAFN
uniref:Uncharacterized protein n=1 Tax=Anguilla anguilla TaxID=7936 RepID=A0A0E9UHZ5_ANGAN